MLPVCSQSLPAPVNNHKGKTEDADKIMGRESASKKPARGKKTFEAGQQRSTVPEPRKATEGKKKKEGQKSRPGYGETRVTAGAPPKLKQQSEKGTKNSAPQNDVSGRDSKGRGTGWGHGGRRPKAFPSNHN